MKRCLLILGLAALVAAAACFDTNVMMDPNAKVDFQEKVDDITYLKNRDSRAKRGAVSEDFYLWPNGIIPYNLTSYFTEQERVTILSAMRHWEDHTCIRFVPVTDPAAHHITLFPGFGCSSYIGRIRANQGVSLGRSCFAFHTIVHELGHVIGFYHEQNRPDRDEHVDIIYENIVPGAEGLFAKLEEHQVRTGGVGYDYNSIMHYDRNTFSRDLLSDTIVAKDPTISIGGATELSEFDKVETNRLYHCDAITPGPKTEVPVLPPPSFPPQPFECGGSFEAESGGFSSPSHDGPMECAWMIRVPEGYRVRIAFRSVAIPLHDSRECTTDFVEVFDTIDGSGRGLGHICGSWRQYTLVTIGEVAYVHFVSTGQAQFEASFVTVDVDECALRVCSHGCENLAGGFECSCPDGYFLSADGRQCFDVNECALNAAGCDHICINTGGSYRCECEEGSELQLDGKSCFEAPSATEPPTQEGCGGWLTATSGSLQSPNWPETYNVNEVCEWVIELPDATSKIEITFDEQVFGIAGHNPKCQKDVLEIYDGLSSDAATLQSMCGVILPEVIRTSSNVVRVVFTAGPAHGAGRKGFKLLFKSVTV